MAKALDFLEDYSLVLRAIITVILLYLLFKSNRSGFIVSDYSDKYTGRLFSRYDTGFDPVWPMQLAEDHREMLPFSMPAYDYTDVYNTNSIYPFLDQLTTDEYLRYR